MPRPGAGANSFPTAGCEKDRSRRKGRCASALRASILDHFQAPRAQHASGNALHHRRDRAGSRGWARSPETCDRVHRRCGQARGEHLPVIDEPASFFADEARAVVRVQHHRRPVFPEEPLEGVDCSRIRPAPASRPWSACGYGWAGIVTQSLPAGGDDHGAQDTSGARQFLLQGVTSQIARIRSQSSGRPTCCSDAGCATSAYYTEPRCGSTTLPLPPNGYSDSGLDFHRERGIIDLLGAAH
jgi:hypothetical protein